MKGHDQRRATYERVRRACCDESPINADQHAEMVTDLTFPGAYQFTFAEQCRWRELGLEYVRTRPPGAAA
jgi:hypothetical protein